MTVAKYSAGHDSGSSNLAGIIESLAHQPVGSRTLATGFDPLDGVLGGGLRTRDLTLVGGLPGVGKTIATLQWARNMAAAGSNALFVCYEHDQRSLLARLLLLEAGELGSGGREPDVDDLRRLVRDITAGSVSIEEATASSLLLKAARSRMRSYADRLFLIRPPASRDGVADIRQIVDDTVGRGAAVVVDYLQKVPVPSSRGEERVADVTEGLKELAMDAEVAVVAVVSGDHEGLGQRRLRLQHLKGASGLAYEADVVVMLNPKFTAVSKLHTAYDPVRAEEFKQWVVFSVDKNRAERSGVDVEFETDFAHYRFVPRGGYVDERLIDGFLFPE